MVHVGLAQTYTILMHIHEQRPQTNKEIHKSYLPGAFKSHSRRRTAMERRQQKPRALARRVGWLLQLSKELDRRRARATSLLQAMVEFVGEAHNGDTNSTAELHRERLGRERREALRLAAEQEQQRMYQE